LDVLSVFFEAARGRHALRFARTRGELLRYGARRYLCRVLFRIAFCVGFGERCGEAFEVLAGWDEAVFVGADAEFGDVHGGSPVRGGNACGKGLFTISNAVRCG
jgi:hypothetical protein